MQNPFLVFLVSEKLDAKLSDNLLKKHFFYRGIKLEVKRERERFQSTFYILKKIK